MSTEAKIGIALIVLLIGAFGFVVWTKMSHRQAEVPVVLQQPEDAHSDGRSPADSHDHGATPQNSASPDGGGEFPFAQTEPEQEPFAPETEPEGFARQVSHTEPSDNPFGDAEPASPPRRQQEPEDWSDLERPPVAQQAPPAGSPFEDEIEPVPSQPARPDQVAQVDAFDPFGDAAAPEQTQAEPPPADFMDPPAQNAASSESPVDEFEPVDEFLPAKPASQSTARQDEPFPVEFEELEPAGEQWNAPVETAQTPPGAMPAAEDISDEFEPAASPADEFVDPSPLPQDFAQQDAELEELESQDLSPAPRSQSQVSVPVELDSPFGEPATPTYQEPAQFEPLPATRQPEVAASEPLPFHSQPAGSQSLDEVYVVQPNDNFWSISRKQYGTARYFQALARYNAQRIPDPQKMRPGMKVLTPEIHVLESRYPDLFPHKSNGIVQTAGAQQRGPTGFFTDAQGRPMYRIGPKDTLTGIAQNHLGRSTRWIQIFEMNRDVLKNPNDLTLGTILRLPADASRVQLTRNAAR